MAADPVRGHNTDGIDPDSTRNVLVEGCYVSLLLPFCMRKHLGSAAAVF